MKKCYLVFLLILTSLLTGCAGALLGGAAGSYYLSKNNDHSKSSRPNSYATDTMITSRVKSTLLRDSVLKFYTISVSTSNGVVNLAGALPSHDVRNRAIVLTQNIKGVKAVNADNLLIYTQH